MNRDGFTVIRVEPDGTQRLWQFDRAGGEPRLVLTDIKPVGYHAWVDADHLALFVLGQPATLQLARVTTGKAEVAARDIGRSLHRVPGTRLVSFVQKETSGAYSVKTIDIDNGRIETLVATVEGSADRDCAWMPDGKTLLMSSGTRIMKWRRGDAGWPGSSMPCRTSWAPSRASRSRRRVTPWRSSSRSRSLRETESGIRCPVPVCRPSLPSASAAARCR